MSDVQTDTGGAMLCNNLCLMTEQRMGAATAITEQHCQAKLDCVGLITNQGTKNINHKHLRPLRYLYLITAIEKLDQCYRKTTAVKIRVCCLLYCWPYIEKNLINAIKDRWGICLWCYRKTKKKSVLPSILFAIAKDQRCISPWPLSITSHLPHTEDQDLLCLVPKISQNKINVYQ